MLLRDYVEQYALEKDLSPNYVKDLRRTVLRLSAWLECEAFASDLTPEIVNEWLASLPPDWKPKTRKHYRDRIVTLWHGLYEAGITDQKPIRVCRPRIPCQPPAAWTREEIRRILTSCQKVSGLVPHSDVTKAAWLVAAVELMYSTGLRLSDALAAQWANVHNGCVSLSQRKTGQPVCNPMSAACEQALAAIRRPGCPWLLTPTDRRRAHQWLRDAVLDSGVRDGSFQRLRKSGASYVDRDNPGAARRLLGHSTPGLAERHYLDPTITDHIRVMPPPL